MRNSILSLFLAISFLGFAQDDDESEESMKMLVKVNPALILSGEIPIYIDFKVNESLLWEVGLGITHYDFMYESIITPLKDSTLLDDANRKYKLGFSFNTNLKYFPSKNRRGWKGIYLGPEFRMKRYNTTVIDPTTVSTMLLKEYRMFFDFKMQGGYMLRLGDRVYLDLYAGIGMRVCKGNRWRINDSTISSKSNMLLNESFPLPSLGFKFGVGI